MALRAIPMDKMNRTSRIPPRLWLWVAGGLLLLGLVGFLPSRLGTLRPAPEEAPRPGARAPRFSLPTLDGETIDLGDLKGKGVILNFWASWCGPCRAEMPALQRIHERYAERGIQVLALNLTFTDDLKAVRGFRELYQLTMPILLDRDGAVMRRYEVSAVPTTFFIGPGGVIHDVVVGGPMSEREIEGRLAAILPKGGPDGP